MIISIRRVIRIEVGPAFQPLIVGAENTHIGIVAKHFECLQLTDC